MIETKLGKNKLSIAVDPWLQRWLPLIRERSAALPVLELGCGAGADTTTLIAAGLSVMAIDLSANAIAEARRVAPSASFYTQDIRAPFPTDAVELGVVLASLSLHYFAWQETLTLVERIHRTLRKNGVLLCRVNSTRDHHYGASGYPPIDTDYYRVEGEPKRFFDGETMCKLFANGWHILALEESTTHKYDRPKVVWEIVIEKL